MGSVKDVVVIRQPKGNRTGLGDFFFSDRYSVFDYGIMPDLIDLKGKSLCMISAYFFEKIEDEGIKTHYLGLVSKGKVLRFDEVDEPTNVFRVKLVRVLNYEQIKKEKGNFLIPLEVIYRNSIPAGSSLLKRFQEGKIKPEDFGLKEIKAGMKLENPIIDFSTKIEDVDRYLTYSEAKEISGLKDDEFDELKRVALKINKMITTEVSKAGIENEDGKLEFAFDGRRNLMVVDAVGTPDECRFNFEGFEVSKEILRAYYRKTDWYEKLKVLKGKENWRELVGTPPKLNERVKSLSSKIYAALCNEITGKKFFDVPSLKEVVKEVREVL
ncbi:MAG: phosphoribosylaminoimidazolesuccinocarboxamide synthase [Archaeoglobaceae archaeon]|nr:phosphoribosylaminoimidazolesuccinocarboxamide synthase [Archaeoglobaceae archaeon]MCX8152474.1 phosphoribosylaminoimidazolesuccinocarboxamide synthase [Archaeoglobaceae archaeon]MDW8013711.1 phosphoribosylaminoimidazolesuccinocarboxamide synthase [Archaeoglobaceae archaeon]